LGANLYAQRGWIRVARFWRFPVVAVFELTVGFYVSARPGLSFFEKKTTSGVRSLGRFLKEIGCFEDETLVLPSIPSSKRQQPG
jgi:hypothetical protein